MFICERQFEFPDPENKDYSCAEVDYYGWIPFDKENIRVPNHRLSLRKNLKTKNYEVYRQYNERVMVSAPNSIGIINKETIDLEVAFKGSLADAIAFADGEWRRYHGKDKKPDEICQHKPPKKAFMCPQRAISKSFLNK